VTPQKLSGKTSIKRKENKMPEVEEVAVANTVKIVDSAIHNSVDKQVIVRAQEGDITVPANSNTHTLKGTRTIQALAVSGKTYKPRTSRNMVKGAGIEIRGFDPGRSIKLSDGTHVVDFT
jgi:uncharacterized protein YaiI (UPF0178 family)